MSRASSSVAVPFAAALITAGLLAVLQQCSAVSFPNRYAINYSCSLVKDLEGVCQIKSRLGTNSSAQSFNGLFMYLGETNCTLTIQQCRKNTCYSLRDLTTLGPPSPDAGIVLTQGWFSSIQIVSGATGLKWTREGVAFKSTGKQVVLRYSTQLCADYYRVRGHVGQQFCSFPIEAITVIDTDSPTSLDCA